MMKHCEITYEIWIQCHEVLDFGWFQELAVIFIIKVKYNKIKHYHNILFVSSCKIIINYST